MSLIYVLTITTHDCVGLNKNINKAERSSSNISIDEFIEPTLPMESILVFFK